MINKYNVIGNINAVGRKIGGVSYPPVLDDGNTVAWYDSQLLDTITKDGGDLVSQWNDRLESGRDLIQGTEINQPLWSADGILFDGVDNFMKTASFTFNQPEFIYMVLKQITWTSGDRLIDGDANSSGYIYQSATTPGLKAAAPSASGQNSNLALNTFGIIRLLLNDSSSKLIINETTAATWTAGTSNMGGFTLARAGASAALFAHIQVKEIILRKVADSAQDESSIYGYLSNKYGI